MSSAFEAKACLPAARLASLNLRCFPVKNPDSECKHSATLIWKDPSSSCCARHSRAPSALGGSRWIIRRNGSLIGGGREALLRSSIHITGQTCPTSIARPCSFSLMKKLVSPSSSTLSALLMLLVQRRATSSLKLKRLRPGKGEVSHHHWDGRHWLTLTRAARKPTRTTTAPQVFLLRILYVFGSFIDCSSLTEILEKVPLAPIDQAEACTL